MQTCPSCDNVLSERAIFCASCAKQARCKKCHDVLEPNARACVSCGTRVEGNGSTEGHSVNSSSANMNTFMLRETTRSRTIEVSFSDTAIVNLGDILGYVGNDRMVKRAPFTQSNAQQENSQLLLTGITEAITSTPDEPNEATEHTETQSTPPTETETDRDRLRQVFFHDGERLVLDNLHLKATSQLDAARRLVYLFLYAHELESRQQISRENINDVLRDVGLYEPNIVNWISTSSDLRKSSEDGQPMFRLRMTGRDEAKKILEQILNPNIPNEWVLSDRSRTRNKGASDPTPSDKAKPNSHRGRKKSAEPVAWADKWASLNLGIDGHSIVERASGLNKGLFGLWAIRKATGDTVKVVSKQNLASFLHRAFVVKVAPSTLSGALESKSAKGKVLRVKGGYEITPTGIADAQSLAGSITGETVATSKVSTKKKR